MTCTRGASALFAIGLLALTVACSGNSATTPTTVSPVAAPSATARASATPAPSAMPATQTPTTSPTPTSAASATPRPTATPSATPAPTATPTPTATPFAATFSPNASPENVECRGTCFGQNGSEYLSVANPNAPGDVFQVTCDSSSDYTCSDASGQSYCLSSDSQNDIWFQTAQGNASDTSFSEKVYNNDHTSFSCSFTFEDMATLQTAVYTVNVTPGSSSSVRPRAAITRLPIH